MGKGCFGKGEVRRKSCLGFVDSFKINLAGIYLSECCNCVIMVRTKYFYEQNNYLYKRIKL